VSYYTCLIAGINIFTVFTVLYYLGGTGILGGGGDGHVRADGFSGLVY
jgi:hypothetical protein